MNIVASVAALIVVAGLTVEVFTKYPDSPYMGYAMIAVVFLVLANLIWSLAEDLDAGKITRRYRRGESKGR